MESLLIKGRIIDAVADEPMENGVILTKGTDIVYVGEMSGCPAYDRDTVVIDAGNGTILPGFIDVHAHLCGEEDAGSFANGTLFGDQLIGAVKQIAILQDAGFTGIRDMSEAGFYLSRGVERGAIRGPKIMPGGKVLSVTGGHVDMYPALSKEEANQRDHLGRLCDGVDDCILAVREQFRQGAKFIKICATGGVSSPTDGVDDVQFSPEELRAIVTEAKRHHSYVTAHCTGNEGAYQCILAGVECIEHGVMLTEREIKLMAEKDIPLVSTLYVSLGVAEMPGLPDWLREKARNCAEYNKRSIALAREYGIRIALGTDFSNSRNTPYARNGLEFEAMCRAGMTPMEAIKAGTINAASVMRNEKRTGSLAAGKAADIVIVDGNPIEDIWCLTDAEHVQLVVQDGEIKKRVGI